MSQQQTNIKQKSRKEAHNGRLIKRKKAKKLKFRNFKKKKKDVKLRI